MDQRGRKTMAKVIMVQGTMSNAGKSLLVAGLCRVFAQDGYRVAPFKSQNMALNSFITKEGLEMGRAQVMQAEAAGIEPSVDMNPILLKPTNDHGSQVIVAGKVLGNMEARDYFSYKKNLVPDIVAAFGRLEEKADIIVIEGAGSPAEINLKENDIVNMGLAHLVDAPVLLVGDIDRGGVFAQLLGTMMLLTEKEKKRVKGLVINKFRGDVTILEPGITMLEEKAEVPVVGVVPYMSVTLDDEDSLAESLLPKDMDLINIGVVRLPRLSNFTDFSALDQIAGVSVHYVRDPYEIEKMDMVILPGTKNTMGDLAWMRESGMESAVKKFAQYGPVFGICGGYQMLGQRIADPEGIENVIKADGSEGLRGLELLPMETVLKPEKVRTQISGSMEITEGALAGFSSHRIHGYEIHMGETMAVDAIKPLCHLDQKNDVVCQERDGGQRDNVYGTYVHGIFDDKDVAYDLCRLLAEKKGLTLQAEADTDYQSFKESQYDLLAEGIRKSMDMDAVYAMLQDAAI